MPGLVELRPIRPTPVAESLPRLRTFVSPFTGVVRSLGETLHAPDEHRLISIGCQLADALPVIGESLDSYTGSEHRLRDAQARTSETVSAAIGSILDTFTPQECANYLRNSGYASTISALAVQSTNAVFVS